MQFFSDYRELVLFSFSLPRSISSPSSSFLSHPFYSNHILLLLHIPALTLTRTEIPEHVHLLLQWPGNLVSVLISSQSFHFAPVHLQTMAAILYKELVELALEASK